MQARSSTLAAALAASCALAACGGGTSTGSTKRASSASQQAKQGGSSLKVIGTPKFASPSSSDPVRSGTVEVDYRLITIRPDTLRVRSGTTVRWKNLDQVAHNVTSVSGPQRFRSADFSEGGGFSVKLTRPGTIHYECTNHPATMNGTIEVLK